MDRSIFLVENFKKSLCFITMNECFFNEDVRKNLEVKENNKNWLEIINYLREEKTRSNKKKRNEYKNRGELRIPPYLYLSTYDPKYLKCMDFTRLKNYLYSHTYFNLDITKITFSIKINPAAGIDDILDSISPFLELCYISTEINGLIITFNYNKFCHPNIFSFDILLLSDTSLNIDKFNNLFRSKHFLNTLSIFDFNLRKIDLPALYSNISSSIFENYLTPKMLSFTCAFYEVNQPGTTESLSANFISQEIDNRVIQTNQQFLVPQEAKELGLNYLCCLNFFVVQYFKKFDDKIHATKVFSSYTQNYIQYKKYMHNFDFSYYDYFEENDSYGFESPMVTRHLIKQNTDTNVIYTRKLFVEYFGFDPYNYQSNLEETDTYYNNYYSNN